MTLLAADFEFIAKLIHQKNGLMLTPEKEYLLETRLSPIARKWNLSDLPALVRKLRVFAEPALLEEISDAMTTNETLFFRDLKPFEALKAEILPKLCAARKGTKRVRIWCAAASSGQEPYSIAITLLEEKHKYPDIQFEIIGTDINKDILKRAEEGIYTQFEVQRGLPIQLLVKYFKQDGDRWQIKDELRRMVQYKVFNLLQDPAQFGQFDIIFCRNVLIYFDIATKQKIVERLHSRLAHDGYVVLGGSEAMLGISEKFTVPAGLRSIYTPLSK
ncbi:MAG: protein-glutamate O-methyltransferase CheR [Alphaproteobacteria bacterium]|jgi:chemotaxis protein methyltransferase CheR|nr:protein-glutamate O-methyltransferase CheR [Alphaproteobacteria bacterium]